VQATADQELTAAEVDDGDRAVLDAADVTDRVGDGAFGDQARRSLQDAMDGVRDPF
jgi:hypothetical protein